MCRGHLERSRKQLSETDRVLVRVSPPQACGLATLPSSILLSPQLASPGGGRGEGLPRSCILHRVVESRVGREEESSEVVSATGRRECPGDCCQADCQVGHLGGFPPAHSQGKCDTKAGVLPGTPTQDLSRLNACSVHCSRLPPPWRGSQCRGSDTPISHHSPTTATLSHPGCPYHFPPPFTGPDPNPPGLLCPQVHPGLLRPPPPSQPPETSGLAIT